MRKTEERYIYKSGDLSLSSSDRPVIYPINAFLENHLKSQDEIKVLLLVKRDSQGNYKQNITEYIDELMSVNAVNANIDYKMIEIFQAQNKNTNEKHMNYFFTLEKRYCLTKRGS